MNGGFCKAEHVVESLDVDVNIEPLWPHNIDNHVDEVVSLQKICYFDAINLLA